MELQFTSSGCPHLAVAARQIHGAELTQEVRLSDGLPDIGRVIGSRGQIVLRSKEWQGDQITVSGGIMVWILYAPEDGTPLRCVDTWVPFQLKWEAEEGGGEGPIRVSPLLRFVDSRNISARKMMVRAGIAAMAEALYPTETEIYAPCELPQDIQILTNTYPVRLPKEAGEKTFLLDEDLTMPPDAAPVEKLLCYTLTPQLSEVRPAGDKVIMRGTGELHVLYRCPEGKLHAVDFEVPLSQYAQLEDAYGTQATADVQMGITNLEMDQLEDQQLRLRCGMVAQYLISDRYLAELTEDAYSPRRQVQPRKESLQLPAMMEQRTETVAVRHQLPVTGEEIADVVFFPDFPRQSKAGDQRILELPGQFQVLYYAEDGSLQCAIGRWEGSMRLSADPEIRLDVVVQPQGKARAAAGAADTELSAQYKLQLNTSSGWGMDMVTELEIGPLQEPDLSRPSLILCRPEGESLWQMAKRCGSTVGDIRRANGFSGEPEETRLLLIPVN